MQSILIAFFLLIVPISTHSQSNNNNKTNNIDPLLLDQVYFYHSDSLMALEKNEGKFRTRTKALGYGGSEGDLIIENEKSSLRIKTTDTIRFAVKTDLPFSNPLLMIKLYHFESEKGNRKAMLSSQSGMFGNSKKVEDEISLNVQKAGDDVFLLIPDKKLTTGEYGFLNMMLINKRGMNIRYTVFTFGID